MSIYRVSEKQINELIGMLNDCDAKDVHLKNAINRIKKNEIVEDLRKKQRKIATIILDLIVDLHPEFTELPYMAMKDIVDNHITTIIAEIAYYEKTMVPDDSLPKYKQLC